MSPRRGASAEYALERNQMDALLRVCVDLEDKVIIGVLLYCGLRVGELAHMNATWITQDGNLRVPAFQKCNCSECRYKGQEEWRPKTKAGIRILPISGQISKDLLTYLSKRPKGLGLTRQTLHAHTKELMQKAGLRVKGPAGNVAFPHALRATCAQMLANGGMEASALCAFMGWQSIAIGDRYIRTSRARELALKQGRAILG